MEIPAQFWWVPCLIPFMVSIISGGAMGAVLTILYNNELAKQAATAKEKATISALVGELTHVRRLCDYNAKMQAEKIAPFIRFPIAVIHRTVFEERHSYPALAVMQKDLEALALGLMEVNQWINLRELMWTAPQVNSLNPQGSTAERIDDLRNKICEVCADKQKLEGVGPENFMYLRGFADVVLNKVVRLRDNRS